MYLDRIGDINETAKIKSFSVFNNWSRDVATFCLVVPTFKRATLLRFALRSILCQQNLLDYEILVVDDCPTRNDETETMMCSEFCQKNIAYYKNTKNLGQPGNWNKCIELSRSEWLIMLQDDDMLYPDFFSIIQKFMNLYGNQVGGYFPSVIQHEFVTDILPKREEQTITARIIKLEDFIQGNVLGAGALGMTFRRDIAIRIGGCNTNSGPAVDYDFYNRYVREMNVVKLYGYPLGVWRTLENVSLKQSTVLFCINWGDILKMDTLENCGLGWLKPLFKHYLKGFDEQHVRNWYMEMGKDKNTYTSQPCSVFDIFVYKIFRFFFAIKRRMRKGSQRIFIQ